MTIVKLVNVADALDDDSGLCHVAYLAAMKISELHGLGQCGDGLVMVLRRLGDQLEERKRQVDLLMEEQRDQARGGLRLVRPEGAGTTVQ